MFNDFFFRARKWIEEQKTGVANGIAEALGVKICRVRVFYA